jgi:uncharacterized membrane protein
MSYVSRFTFHVSRFTNLDFWAHCLAWGLVLVYVVGFTRLAILRHVSFNSSGFDLGIYDQVTWNTFQGRPFFYTTTGEPLLHLSNHASLNILLVAPFYFIYSGPEMLLFLQAAAIGLGGLPLFWLGREKLHSNLAGLSLLLAYLLFPTLQVVTLWDYHPPALSVGFFMFAFYFLVRRKRGWFLLFVILAMMGKEQLPLQAAFLGLYALIRYRDWPLGLTTIGLSLVWFLVVMEWLIPANSVVGEHIFLGYYADFGDSPLEIMATVITRPDLVLQNLWQPVKLRYLFDVLAPVAFLPLAGLPVLLIGTPSFAINLLSANPAMHDATGGQYGADVAPWLAWGALFGLLYLSQGLTRLWPQAQTAIITGLSAILLAAALIWQIFWGFSSFALDPPQTRWTVTDHDRLAQRFLAQIPPDAPVAAQGKLYPHLSDRLIAYQLPNVNEAEYVIMDVTNETWPIHPNDLRALTDELLKSGEFGVLDAADGYLLLRRGQAETTLPTAFYDFARVAEVTPQYPLAVEFGDKLRLLGFDVLDDPRRQETSVRLYWQALGPIEADLRLYPFFIDETGQVIETTNERPLITQLWYPPAQWRPGEYVVAQTIPWTLGNRWSLAVGVLAGDEWSDWSQRLPVRVLSSPPSEKPGIIAPPSGGPGGKAQVRLFEARTWARLATFERQGRKLVEIVPAEPDLQPPIPRQANFGDLIALRGYQLSPEVGQAGRDLTLTLYWQALAEIPLDYTVFVHVLSPDGQLVAQDDNGPWWEVPLPTSTWQPGENLRDRHTLHLPPDLSPGTYQLQIGLYYWQTLERLPVLEGSAPVNNFVALGSIMITR